MAKLTGWLVILIGILLAVPLIWTLSANMLMINSWLIAALVIVIGIVKVTMKKR